MPSFFLTAPDPDYRIKGSRDPLGFQSLWQQTGRLIIPHLSTVSNFLQDFQTLALAWQVRSGQHWSDAEFVFFFQRWEQMMAYVRKSMGDERVLGIVRVQKRWGDEKLPVSSEASDVILLENQRGVGVWGRYNSPFTQMRILQDRRFEEIFSGKIKGISRLPRFQECLKKSKFNIEKTDLADFCSLFNLPEVERQFWQHHLLADHAQDDFRHQVSARRDAISGNNFFAQLAILRTGAGEALAQKLLAIEHTERLLCPLSRVFRYLQSRSFWSKDDLEADSFIQKCRASAANVQSEHLAMPTEKNAEKRQLLAMFHAKSNWQLVEWLAARNREVAERRGGAAWAGLENGGVEIYHREGANHDTSFDPQDGHDNDYFIGSYLGLYDALRPQN
ncbi:MAG: hypothetical protein KF734_02290 [Saprospiraceae bacterium]|nr:hypothetical protein [Saprospiraceae bacterium]